MEIEGNADLCASSSVLYATSALATGANKALFLI